MGEVEKDKCKNGWDKNSVVKDIDSHRQHCQALTGLLLLKIETAHIDSLVM
jgi:hypothetical protein